MLARDEVERLAERLAALPDLRVPHSLAVREAAEERAPSSPGAATAGGRAAAGAEASGSGSGGAVGSGGEGERGPASGVAPAAAAAEGARVSGQREQRRVEYLRALLSHDPGVFLERYGTMLTARELSAFDRLRGDYEVDFWCKYAEDRLPPPAAASPPPAAAAAAAGGGGGAGASPSGANGSGAADAAASARRQESKRRRMAYLERVLMRDGSEYFGDDAMHARAPLLFEQYNGPYRGGGPPPPPSLHQPPHTAGGGGGGGDNGPAAAGAGGGGGAAGAVVAGGAGSLAGWFLEQQDRMGAEAKLRAERAAAERAARDESESEESEEEEEEEEEEEADRDGGMAEAGTAGGGAAAGGGGSMPSAAPGQRPLFGAMDGGVGGDGSSGRGRSTAARVGAPVPASSAARRRQAAQEEGARLRGEFLEAMQQRFLAGEDGDFVDYAAIDGDARLDEHWAAQQQRDAEDAWFDDD